MMESFNALYHEIESICILMNSGATCSGPSGGGQLYPGSASTRPMQLSLDMSAIHCSFLFPEQVSKPNKDAQTATRVVHVAHMLQGLSACEAALEEKGRWQQLPDSMDQFGRYVLC